MTLKPLGDSAWLVEFPGKTGEAALSRVMGLAAVLQQTKPAGVLDIVPSFASLAVHFGTGDPLEIRHWIASAVFSEITPDGGEIDIHVCYGGENGPDLESLAAAKGMTEEEVIRLHSAPLYTVAAIGFSPGFPYLLGLPEALHIPRRATPRLSVPSGSVAIASSQTGIYPFDSPGGWHLLGKASVQLFNPHLHSPALLHPGDRVRFVPVRELPASEPTNSLPPAFDHSDFAVEVIDPGAMTTVQDLGRTGHEASGVSPGGAADPRSLRMANLLVGNPEGAAGLEVCLRGPVLKFHRSAVVAIVSATGRPHLVKAGETVDFSRPTHGVRSYIAISGGISVPNVLGSASTDLRGRFGGFEGRPLIAGDLLEIGRPDPHPKSGDWHIGRPGSKRWIELRYIKGVQQHWFSDTALKRFRQGIFVVSPKSDRMGARLTGDVLELEYPREMTSQPVASGSIQVPPDGQPIVLLAERQTIGGYPQIGHVISADLPALALAWPGTSIKFREVTVEEAWELHRQAELDFVGLRSGLDLLK